VVLSLCSLDEDINAEVPRKGCVGASWRSAAACADIPEDPVRNSGIRRIMGVFPGIGIAEHRDSPRVWGQLSKLQKPGPLWSAHPRSSAHQDLKNTTVEKVGGRIGTTLPYDFVDMVSANFGRVLSHARALASSCLPGKHGCGPISGRSRARGAAVNPK